MLFRSELYQCLVDFLKLADKNPCHPDASISWVTPLRAAVRQGQVAMTQLLLSDYANFKGEEQENCFGAVEFVEQLRRDKHSVRVPKRVIVLGGGNTAMDAASESARMGAEKVVLAYRRGKGEMGAYDFEYDLAKGTGVEGWFNVSPLEILGNGKVSGVRFIRTKKIGRAHV